MALPQVSSAVLWHRHVGMKHVATLVPSWLVKVVNGYTTEVFAAAADETEAWAPVG